MVSFYALNNAKSPLNGTSVKRAYLYSLTLRMQMYHLARLIAYTLISTVTTAFFQPLETSL